MGNRTARIDGLQFFGVWGGWGSEFSVGLVDGSERNIVEADEPVALFGFLDPDAIPDQGAGDVDEVALPFDLTGAAHGAGRQLGAVTGFGEAIGQLAGGGAIEAGRQLLAQGFVRSLMIEVVLEGAEALV